MVKCKKRIIKEVHISQIRVGDAIIYQGCDKTVGRGDIRESIDGTITLCGDMYKLGYEPVKKVMWVEVE